MTEESIIKNLHINIANETVEKIMDPPLPSVPKETSVNIVRSLLEDHPSVLIMERDYVVGIITRSDLLKTVLRPHRAFSSTICC